MKNFKSLVLVAALAAFGLSNVNAQADASAEATATATILQDVTVTKNTDLDFGVVVPGTAPTVVTILAAEGAVAGITSGLGTLISTGDNAVTSAVSKFTVTGSGTTIYTITLPVSIDLEGPGDDMNCILNSSALVGVNITLGGLITAAVNDEIFVGGALTVGANQATGVYTQTFDLEVNYL